MKISSLVFGGGLFLAAFFVGTIAHAEADASLQPIFNGRDLTGWTAKDMNRFWRVENGVLIGESDGKLTESFLLSEKDYADFVLEFDVRWKGETDSGIDIRKPRIQLQLGVSRSLKRDMSGSLYIGKAGYSETGTAKDAAKLMHPEGEWNTFRLQAKGNTFTVWINGQKAVEYTNDKFSGSAPLGLQIHGGLKMKVEYRNIRAAVL